MWEGGGALVLARRGCPSQRGAHPWPQAGYSRLTLASRGGVIIAIIIIVTSSSTPLLSIKQATLGCSLRDFSVFKLGYIICHIRVLSPHCATSFFYQRQHILLLCAVAAAAHQLLPRMQKDCNNVVLKPSTCAVQEDQHPFQETASNQGRALGYFALSCPFLSCSNSHLSSSNCSLILENFPFNIFSCV